MNQALIFYEMNNEIVSGDLEPVQVNSQPEGVGVSTQHLFLHFSLCLMVIVNANELLNMITVPLFYAIVNLYFPGDRMTFAWL